MQVAMRRLIIIGAISIGGAAAGLALGNFAAGGRSPTGAEELADYSRLFAAQDNAATFDTGADAGFAERTGPRSYTCEGCDAHLYNEMTLAPASLAETAPLPPYVPEEMAVRAPQPPSQPQPRPQRSPAPAGLMAVPGLPPVLAADRAPPVLQPPAVPPAIN